MKLLFIGSLINLDTLDTIMLKSKVKASNAPVYFENMLIKGLDEAGTDTTVVSVPTVSMYPGGQLLAWGRRKEQLNSGKKISWIPCLNLIGVKHLCISVGTMFEIARWAYKNREYSDKVIMNYSVHPAYSAATQRMGKLLKIKTCSIITDLPEYLYKMGKQSGIKAKLNDYYSRKMVKCQGRFDMYVCLTEHMPKRMGIEEKPWILMEGFSDESTFSLIPDCEKNEKKTVMYAGRLSEDFNIKSLLMGFMKTKGDYELWLFGSGDLVDYIRKCEKMDNRIKYFGKVERRNLLEHQKKAHLLISVKSPDEDHSNYAFPSKILEYMTSGTATASTKVGGIPENYFEYIYPIQSCDVDGITKTLTYLLEKPLKEMDIKGKAAQKYAKEEKNYKKQCKRITDFLYIFVNSYNG